MRKLLIIILLALPFWGSSQAMMGYTYTEVWDSWADDDDSVREGKVSSHGIQYITVSTEYFVIGYYFNETYHCDQVYIFPNTMAGVNGLAERYNGKYTIVDNKNWKAYLSGGVYDIKLMYDDKMPNPFFYWY